MHLKGISGDQFKNDRGGNFEMKKLLSLQDFKLLDVIHTKDGRILTIGLKNKDGYITSASAYLAYMQGRVISKTKWTKIENEKSLANL